MYALLGDIVFSTANASIPEARGRFRMSKKDTECTESNKTSVCDSDSYTALKMLTPEKTSV